ncbi:hypothetical protein Tco_0730791 [Tanacetum coccineum]
METSNLSALVDYSNLATRANRNTIELPGWEQHGLPLRSDTIWLVQNRCSFHGLRSEDPNQHLKDFLKLVDSLDLDSANTLSFVTSYILISRQFLFDELRRLRYNNMLLHIKVSKEFLKGGTTGEAHVDLVFSFSFGVVVLLIAPLWG